MKKLICTFLILSFISTFVMAEMKYGQLNVLSRTKEYKIILDEELKGLTPLKLERVIAGTHHLRALESDSAAALDKIISIKAGELTTIVVEDEIAAARPQEDVEEVLRTAQYNSEKRNPEHAAYWSIIPGGGQVYNGQYLKGVVAYFAVLLSALAAWGNATYAGLTLAVWLYSAYDAHSTAEEYNKNLKKKYGLSSIQLLDTAALNSML
jgi:hypothetical protein